jgi:F-type H+-transporting ATPase subunit b
MLAFPPDFTFVIQLVSFFVLLAVLNWLLFRPFMALLAEREQRTEGAARDAAEEREEVDVLAHRLEAELAAARAEANAEAERIRREARAEEATMFKRANAEAAARLAELRAHIDKEREQAGATLRREADTLAGRMVDAVLPRDARA